MDCCEEDESRKLYRENIDLCFSSCKSAFTEFVLLAESLSAIERGTKKTHSSRFPSTRYLTLKSIQHEELSVSTHTSFVHPLQNCSSLEESACHAGSILKKGIDRICHRISARRKECKTISALLPQCKLVAVDSLKRPLSVLGRVFSIAQGDLVGADCHFNHKASPSNSIPHQSRYFFPYALPLLEESSLKISLITLANHVEICSTYLHDSLQVENYFSSQLSQQYFSVIAQDIFRRISEESCEHTVLVGADNLNFEVDETDERKSRQVFGKYIVNYDKAKIVIALNSSVAIAVELVSHHDNRTDCINGPFHNCVRLCLLDTVKSVLQLQGRKSEFVQSWIRCFNSFFHIGVLRQAFMNFKEVMLPVGIMTLRSHRIDKTNFVNLETELENFVFSIECPDIFYIEISMELSLFKVRHNSTGGYIIFTSYSTATEIPDKLCSSNQLAPYLKYLGYMLCTRYV